MIDKVKNARQQILFIELAGLLHDIGKLSKAFLEYRQVWQDDPSGYDKDPHEHEYFNHEVFKDLIPHGFNKRIQEFSGEVFGEPDFSIRRAVHYHINPNEDMRIVKMLKAADGVDSAIDRNNPLWSAEQKQSIFRSNVFGFESNREIKFEDQEAARRRLYMALNEELGDYFNSSFKERLKILGAIKEAFSEGLSDTCRPQNDTTLWEHSYAVASILKVIAVHNLFCVDEERMDDFRKVRFGILGIGWDGMRFISYGGKIGDITGRKKILDEIKKAIKTIIEDEIPIGNEIYADDNGIYFIVPAKLKAFTDLWSPLEKRIQEIAANESSREMQAISYTYDGMDDEGTRTLTSLLLVMEKLRKETSFPFNSKISGFDDYYSSKFTLFNQGDEICPICRRRPIDKSGPDARGTDKKVCGVCRERRKILIENKETPFINEIVDQHGRAALIVARFGLDEWLNGRMIRSLFVTEAHGIMSEIDHLGNVKQFCTEESIIKEYFEKNGKKYDFSRIKGDIDTIDSNRDPERARYTVFLYGRRAENDSIIKDEGQISRTRDYWKYFHGEAKKEHPNISLCNLLTAKTPTPSTILDVWETTGAFLQTAASGVLDKLLPIKQRVILDIDLEGGSQLPEWNGTLECEIEGFQGKFELIRQNNHQVSVVALLYSPDNKKRLEGARLKIVDNEESWSLLIKRCDPGYSYLPKRIITISPNLLIAIVPADRVIEITSLIYQKYIEQFGKVMGRLPFSVGNVFFSDRMPMFVVLDAAKRMIANFDTLARKAPETFVVTEDSPSGACHKKFNLHCQLGGLEREISWILPDNLGNCKQDYYHTMMLVEGDKEALSTERTSYVDTVVGNAVHFSEIKKGDHLKTYPNYFDFEFLDSNARRYDIGLNRRGRRCSNVADVLSKPILLDELDQKVVKVWQRIFQGGQIRLLTDTKLRNLQSLWLTKYREWHVDLTRKEDLAYQQWLQLVQASLAKELGLKTHLSNQSSELNEMLGNGLLFETLELYLGILKERISQG